MTDDVFIKFKMNELLKSNGIDLMQALIISPDREKVDQWHGESERPASPERPNDDKSKGIFVQVAREFETSMEKFVLAIPDFMQFMPLALQLLDDRQLRAFVKERGSLIED